jgi:hypothetical protein
MKKRKSSNAVPRRVRVSLIQDDEDENENLTQLNSQDPLTVTRSSKLSLGRRSSVSIDHNLKYSASDIEAGLNDFCVPDEEKKNRPWTVDDFTLGKPLGKGKFGNVYLAKQKYTQAQIALKALFKAPMVQAGCLNVLKREIEIQCRLSHPNIARLFGCVNIFQYQ